MINTETQLQLIARNEGKIKSYESCVDVRAWSHDVATQDRYLREWMKCDMPVCVIPMSTVLGFLRIMTCGSRSRAAPRCHPNCKSKIILDSITNSCQVMKDCLKVDEDLEQFFIEDELETSHWPCDRCLEALKNIKLFWKILLEKVFNINISKAPIFRSDDNCNNCGTESVRDVAKNWQKEMLQQALLVKALTPQLSCTCTNRKKCDSYRKLNVKKDTNFPRTPYSEGDYTLLTNKVSKGSLYSNKSQKLYRENVCSCNLRERSSKHCRCVSVRVKTASVACNTCDSADKLTIEKLKSENVRQKAELEKLHKENASLKSELQKAYVENKLRTTFYSSKISSGNEKRCPYALLPRPFEESMHSNDTCSEAKDADSEMIITLQNCKNEGFQHVSLLQVLHKTNDPIRQEVLPLGPCVKKEDPICLLTKVQTTLGEMVKREMRLVSSTKKCKDANTSDIEASFHTAAAVSNSMGTNSSCFSSQCTSS